VAHELLNSGIACCVKVKFLSKLKRGVCTLNFVTKMSKLVITYLLCLVFILAIVSVSFSGAQKKTVADPEMRKEMQMMSGILDIFLKQNFPNPFGFAEKTKGMYLEGYGAVFSVQVGLFNQVGTNDLTSLITLEARKLESNKDESNLVLKNQSDPNAPSGILNSGAGSSLTPRIKEEIKTEEEIKKELVEKLTMFMADYGNTFKQLNPEDWFTIAAYPSGSLFTDEGNVKLIVKVKKKYLLDYQKSKMTIDELKKKVEVIE